MCCTLEDASQHLHLVHRVFSLWCLGTPILPCPVKPVEMVPFSTEWFSFSFGKWLLGVSVFLRLEMALLQISRAVSLQISGAVFLSTSFHPENVIPISYSCLERHELEFLLPHFYDHQALLGFPLPVLRPGNCSLQWAGTPEGSPCFLSQSSSTCSMSAHHNFTCSACSLDF